MFCVYCRVDDVSCTATEYLWLEASKTATTDAQFTSLHIIISFDR